MRMKLERLLVIGLLFPSFFYAGIGEYPSDSTDKLGRLGAWGSVLALFATEAVFVEKLVETGCDRFFAHIPGLSELKGSGVSSLLGSAIALPATCVSFARSREILWYFFFVFYTGRRASPQLAREALAGLSNYIDHLNMLKEVYRELEQLLRSAEQAAEQPTGGRDSQAIAKKLILLVQDAVASGEAYIIQAKTRFELLGIYELAQYAEEPQSKFIDERGLPAISYIRSAREEMRPAQLAIDLSALDRLVRDLLNYWNSYLAGLVSTIDHQVALCQNVYAVEQFIITVLRRNLVPVSISSNQKPGTPSPSIGTFSSQGSQKPSVGNGSFNNNIFGQKGLTLNVCMCLGGTDYCPQATLF